MQAIHILCAGTISLRHYSISVVPSGIRKSLKTLLQHKALPKMGDFQDVSEFVMKSGYGSVRVCSDCEEALLFLCEATECAGLFGA